MNAAPHRPEPSVGPERDHAGPGGPHGAAAEPGSDHEPESQVKKLSPSGLLVSAAAAATTTVIGGHLGVVGTVAGAGITSVVSAMVLAFYTDSVNRGASKLKQVAAKERGHEAGTGPGAEPAAFSSRTAQSGEGGRAHRGSATAAEDAGSGADEAADDAPRSRPRLGKIIVLALGIGLLAIGAVFGIQQLTGTELSPGTGQIQRGVTGSDRVQPRDSSSTDDQQQEQDGTDPGQQDQDGTSTTDTEQDQEAPADDGQQSDDSGGDDAPADDAPAPEGSAPTGGADDGGADQGTGDGGA